MAAKSQSAVIVAGVGAVACLTAAAKLVAKNYSVPPVVVDFDRATNFHDPQFAASFAAAAVCVVIVLFLSFSGSEFPNAHHAKGTLPPSLIHSTLTTSYPRFFC